MLATLLRMIGAYRVYEGWLTDQVKSRDLPQHIGIVLDGNRRWGIYHTGIALDGHRIGAKAGEDFLEWCLELGIKTVTVYVFSTENFQRPKEEVDTILGLVEEEALKLMKDQRIHENKVRVTAIGRRDLLPRRLQTVLQDVEDATKRYDEHYLNVAIAYGGRAEIVDAARKIADGVRKGELAPDSIDEDMISKHLYTAHLPNPYPDVVIRTSGEERLSGFLLWQSAYSEFVFLDVYWPQFRKIDLLRAIRTFQLRRRRFGK